jgi:hypothetical protein
MYRAFIGLALLSLASIAWGQTYYVDATNGNDNWTGTLPDAQGAMEGPWRTLGKVSVVSQNPGLQPGDVVRFKRGQRFYIFQNGVLGTSGTAEFPILFTGYGDPALPAPILSSGKRIDSSQDPAWADLGAGRFIYTGYSGTVVSNIWENGIPIKRASSDQLSDGKWFLTTGAGIYYRPDVGNPADHEIFLANNTVVLNITDRSHLIFDGLAFEYSANAIYGTAFGAPIHHITVRNCRFYRVEEGFHLESRTEGGIVRENHDIVAENNEFDSIKFGVHLHSKYHGIERHYNVRVTGNSLRNIDLNAAYVLARQNTPVTSPDVEVLTFDNLQDSYISRNDLRRGVKASEGYVNATGAVIRSVGIIVWNNPGQILRNVHIEANQMHDLGIGIIFGASPGDLLRDNLISNNIVSNGETGLRLNASDSTASTRVYHNTMFANGISTHLNSGGAGYQLKNNLSVNPLSRHVVIEESSAMSQAILDYNLYVPDGALFRYAAGNVDYANLSAWRLVGKDPNSSAADQAFLAKAVPVEAIDFKPQANSAAIDNGITLADVAIDFGATPRPLGSNSDIGAWEADTINLAAGLAATPSPVLLGSSITYTLTLTNQGPSTATGIYQSGLTGCTLATTTLASGASTPCTVSIPTTAIGTVTRTVSVNALEFDLNATDNTASVSTTVTAPDLVPTAMSVSKSGSRVYVSDTVNNQGNASAGAFTLKYYLSTDTAHNSNDLALATASGGSTACTRTVTSLNVGASSSISNKLCYKPAGVVSGTRYYILTVDDADKQVIESNEVNNVRATTGTVRW